MLIPLFFALSIAALNRMKNGMYGESRATTFGPELAVFLANDLVQCIEVARVVHAKSPPTRNSWPRCGRRFMTMIEPAWY